MPDLPVLRVPDDVDDDWIPDGYEPPSYDDPGDFAEPDHVITEESADA